jgi:hypothetical protein
VLQLRLLIKLLCSLPFRLQYKPQFGLLFGLPPKFLSRLLYLLESLRPLFLPERRPKHHLKLKMVLSQQRKCRRRTDGLKFVRMPLNVQHSDRVRTNPKEGIVLKQQQRTMMERRVEKKVSIFEQ